MLATSLAVRAAPATPTPAMARYIALFWDQADLSQESLIEDRAARRVAVYEEKRAVAERTQRAVLALLADRQAVGAVGEITPLWIVNAIAFEATEAVVEQLRQRPEIQGVSEDKNAYLEPSRGADQPDPKVGTVEANVDRINAPDVWADGITGGGIVVATIDSGVEGTHPALAAQYRGPCGGSHACSWFDAVNGASQPYDDYALPDGTAGHGTHAMGVLAGGDGPGPFTEDIGVAPGARWIAAKAFDSNGLGLLSHVLTAMQWVQAPGATPSAGGGDPLLAPDVVSNSWAMVKCQQEFLLLAIESWRTAGILPVFMAGDFGGRGGGVVVPGSIESPADLAGAFAVGATRWDPTTDDDGNPTMVETVAEWSGRGPGCTPDLNVIKPDVAAPGETVRSASTGGAYTTWSGTSMAAPHAAGEAALVMQAVGGPTQYPVATIEQFMREYSVDLNGDEPGGAGSDPNLGHGRIDARLAVDGATAVIPVTGTLTGLVAQTGCRPTAGLTVRATDTADANDVRTVTVDAQGRYTFEHILGTYEVRVTAGFGYLDGVPVTVTIPQATTVTQDLVAVPALCGTVAGRATRATSGEAIAGAEVRLVDSRFSPVTTDANGDYAIPDVPLGTYQLRLSGDRCGDTASRLKSVTVSAPGTTTVDFAADVRRDAYGYWCTPAPGAFTPGTSVLDLGGDDQSIVVPLPWAFPLYGQNAASAAISTNGYVSFGGASDVASNTAIPTPGAPDRAIFALWDDLVVGDGAQVLTASSADRFVIEWRNVSLPDASRATFEVVLHRNGDVEIQYAAATSALARGLGATIGLENADGTVGFPYAFAEEAAVPGTGVLFSAATPVGLLAGVVSDGSAAPVPGATVTATPTVGASRTSTTDAQGRYKIWLAPGGYGVAAQKFGHASATTSGAVSPGATTVRDITLAALPVYPLGGIVTDASTGAPLPGVEVRLDAPVPASSTDATGAYAFAVPAGTYAVSAGRGCQTPQTATVSHASPATTRDFALSVTRDAFPFTCRELAAGAEPIWALEEEVALEGDDQWSDPLELGFSFPFYGRDYSTVTVSTNGFLRFDEGSAEPDNRALPWGGAPNAAVYALWDDLVVDARADVVIKKRFDAVAIEWRDVQFYDATWLRMTFEAILWQNGDIELRYGGGNGALTRGVSATIGVEDHNGARAVQYASTVGDGTRLVFHPETHPLTGRVRESVTEESLGGATVRATGPLTITSLANAEGVYRMLVREGTYTLTASKYGFRPSSVPLVMSGPATQDFHLAPDGIYKIFGWVSDSANPARQLAGVLVRTDDPDAPVVSTVEAGADKGRYELSVPPGTYVVSTGGRCRGGASATVVVTDDNVRRDFSIGVLDDAAFRCQDDVPAHWQSGLVPLVVDGATGDDSSVGVTLPFEFPLYGASSRFVQVSTNGFLRLDTTPAGNPPASEVPPASGDPCHAARTCIPSAAAPNLAIYPLWDDLIMDAGSSIDVGPAFGLEGFAIEWRNARFKGDVPGIDPTLRVTFQAVLYPNGVVDFQYHTLPASPSAGSRPVAGLESAAGTAGLHYPRAFPTTERIRFCPTSICPV